MTVNKAEDRLQDRLVNDIAHMRREQSASKTRQQFGGDNFVYGWSSTTTASFALPSGQQAVIQTTITSTVDVALFPIHLFTLYANSSSPDANYAWPYGPSLTTDQKRYIQVSHFYDQLNTTSNARTWNCFTTVYNGDVSTLNFYYQSVWRFPWVAS